MDFDLGSARDCAGIAPFNGEGEAVIQCRQDVSTCRSTNEISPPLQFVRWSRKVQIVRYMIVCARDRGANVKEPPAHARRAREFLDEVRKKEPGAIRGAEASLK